MQIQYGMYGSHLEFRVKFRPYDNLMNRWLRSKLPTSIALFKPHPVETSGTEATLRERQKQHKSVFDRKTGPPLALLKPGDVIRHNVRAPGNQLWLLPSIAFHIPASYMRIVSSIIADTIFWRRPRTNQCSYLVLIRKFQMKPSLHRHLVCQQWCFYRSPNVLLYLWTKVTHLRNILT